jgi:hypothetical protein
MKPESFVSTGTITAKEAIICGGPEALRNLEERLRDRMRRQAAQEVFQRIEAAGTPVTCQIEFKSEYDLAWAAQRLAYVVHLVPPLEPPVRRRPPQPPTLTFRQRLAVWWQEMQQPLPYDGPRG